MAENVTDQVTLQHIVPEHSYRWCNRDEYESMDTYLERGKEKCLNKIVHHLQSIPSKTKKRVINTDVVPDSENVGCTILNQCRTFDCTIQL